MTEEELRFVLKMRDEASAALAKMGNALKGVGDKAGTTATETAKVGTSFDDIAKKAQQAAKVIGGFWASSTLAKGAINAFGQYQIGIVGVQKTTNMAGKDLDVFVQKFDVLDRSLKGIDTSQIAKLAETVGQMGVTGSDAILDVTEVLAKLGVTSDVVGEQGATMVARILNLTGEGVAGVKEFGDSLNTLGNASAAGENEILNMASGVAQATAEFGLSIKQLLGISAAARELDLNFEVTGSAFGRVLRNLRDGAATGADSFKTFLKQSDLTQESFNALLQSDPTEILVRFAETYAKLTASGQSVPFLDSLGLNTDEIKRVFGIIGQRATSVRATMAKAFDPSTDGALDREYQAFAAAQNSQIEALVKAWNTLKRTIGEALAPLTGAIVSAATSAIYTLVDAFNALPDGVGTFLAAAAVVAPALTGIRLAANLLGPALTLVGRSILVAFGPVGIAIAAFLTVRSLLSDSTALSKEYNDALLGVAASYKVLDEASNNFSANRGEDTKFAWIGAVTAAKDATAKALETAKQELENQSSLSISDFNPFQFQDGSKIQAYADAKAKVAELSDEYLRLQAELDAAKNANISFVAKVKEGAVAVLNYTEGDKELFAKLVPSAKQNEDLAKFSALLDKLSKATPAQRQEVGISDAQLNGFREAVALQKELADNPLFTQERGLKDQIADIKATTGEAKNRLEAERQIRDAVEATGLGYDAVSAKLRPLITQMQEARRAAAVTTFLGDIDKQIQDALAITAAQKEQVEIQRQINQLQEENGKLTAAEVAAIRDKVAALNEVKRAVALGDVISQSQQALESILAGTDAERERLRIKKEIADFEKQNGALNGSQRAQLENALTAQSQAEAYKTLLGSLDPAVAATAQYEDALKTLDAALRTGLITQTEYNRLSSLAALTMGQNADVIGKSIASSQEAIAILGVEERSRGAVTEIIGLQNEAIRAGIDLTSEENRARLAQAQALIVERERLKLADDTKKALKDIVTGMNEEVAALRLQGPYAEADRKALQQANALRKTGVGVTEEYTAALQEYQRALQDANSLSDNGVAQWVDSVGTFQEGMATITKDGIGGLSDAITDLLTGGSGGFLELARNIGKQLTKTIVDDALKSILKSKSGADPRTAALDRAQAAIAKVESLGSSLTTPQVNIQAASVALNGAGLGATGVTPNLGGVGAPIAGTTNAFASGGLPGSSDVQKQIYDFFAAKGLKPHQIAGILGNISAESGFNPTAVGDGGNAFGLFQHNDRGPALLQSLGGQGNLGNVNGQLEFAWKELLTTEKASFEKLLASTDVKGATDAFVGFERPSGYSAANPENSMGYAQRLGGAQAAYTQFATPAIDPAAQQAQFGLAEASKAAATAVQSATSALTNLAGSSNTAKVDVAGVAGSMVEASASSGTFGDSLLGLIQQLLGASGQGGGIAASILGTLFHGGGVVGSGGAGTRMLPASTWAGAPRFHNGLKNDEYAAILQRNERVLTEDQDRRNMAILNNAAEGNQRSGGGRQVIINNNITTPDVGGFRRSQSRIDSRTATAMDRAMRKNN